MTRKSAKHIKFFFIRGCHNIQIAFKARFCNVFIAIKLIKQKFRHTYFSQISVRMFETLFVLRYFLPYSVLSRHFVEVRVAMNIERDQSFKIYECDMNCGKSLIDNEELMEWFGLKRYMYYTVHICECNATMWIFVFPRFIITDSFRTRLDSIQLSSVIIRLGAYYCVVYSYSFVCISKF